MESVVTQAIERAGGVASLAKAVGVAHTSVIGWRDRGCIPAKRIKAVADAAGMAPADLLPSAQPAPQAAA